MLHMDKKKRKKYLTLIMPLIGIAIGVIIAPLDLLPLWLSPQPNTIEKVLEEAGDIEPTQLLNVTIN